MAGHQPGRNDVSISAEKTINTNGVDVLPRVTEAYIQRRRRVITDAAWRCFARDGFHATTMDDIIDASGLSPSVVYRWFTGKDELVNAVVSEALGGIVTTMATLRAADPPLPIPEVVRTLLEAAREETTRDGLDLAALPLQAWTEALRTPEINDRVVGPYQELLAGLAEVIGKHQQQGTLDPDADPGELARPIFSLIPGFLLQRVLIGPVPIERYVAAIRLLVEHPRSNGTG